jgi:ankyrin repeat protein
MLTISIWPFIQATCKGVYPSVLHRFTLLKCNSSVNLCGTNGFTPLHVACDNGDIDIVNILLKCNSSVNLCDTNGYTPLHVACIHDNIDIVNILLKCNSSVNLCDTNGYTPLHVACNYIYIAISTSNM